MYSLEINFLNDREPIPVSKPGKVGVTSEPGDPRFLIAGVAVGVASVAVVMGSWAYVNSQNQKLQNELATLENQAGQLQSKVQEVQAINAEVQQIETQTTFFANIFNTSVKPMSALLQELRDRLPQGVQVSNLNHTIEQAPPEAVQPESPWSIVKQNIEISGYARSFDQVNDFVLTLKQSPFFKETETELLEAKLVDNPTKVECDPNFGPQQATCPPTEFQLPKVVEYKIQATISNVSAAEILADLERTKAEGLTTRIKTLQQQGVLQP